MTLEFRIEFVLTAFFLQVPVTHLINTMLVLACCVQTIQLDHPYPQLQGNPQSCQTPQQKLCRLTDQKEIKFRST